MVWFSLLAMGCTAAVPEPIRVDRLPLLFVDDGAIESRTTLTRMVHVARTRPQPVLEPDRAWEGQRVYTYGSVYHDSATGTFRMWYLGRPQLEGTKQAIRAPSLRFGGSDVVLYTTSRDGLAWDKPALGLHAFDGSAANNIVFDLHSPSVLIDALEKDPAKRYKMIGSGKGGYHAAYSTDGLTWMPYPKNPILPQCTTRRSTPDMAAPCRPSGSALAGRNGGCMALRRSTPAPKAAGW